MAATPDNTAAAMQNLKAKTKEHDEQPCLQADEVKKDAKKELPQGEKEISGALPPPRKPFMLSRGNLAASAQVQAPNIKPSRY